MGVMAILVMSTLNTAKLRKINESLIPFFFCTTNGDL